MVIINVFGIFVGVLWITLLAYSSIVSHRENEKRANLIFLLATITSVLLLIGIWSLSPTLLSVIILLSLLTIGFLFLFKYRSIEAQEPENRIDERDIMFSRCNLVPSSDRFSTYYLDKPERLKIDNSIRKLPGLLQEGTLYFDSKLFAIAKANFHSIAGLHEKIDGKKSDTDLPLQPESITQYLKEWAKTLGVHSIGITPLKETHVYTHKGRGDRYGEPLDPKHLYAIAITVEMNHEMVASAPAAPIVVESSQQYLNSGTIAVQIADFIRKLGYEAKAHIDGNYEIICPLVARDAGLGEIGRMGLLMDKTLGPRCRIAVITTDLQLITDVYRPDPSVIHFCGKCKKCAKTCPAQAIVATPRQGKPGHLRWKIDSEACFSFWCKAGTDCGRCMSVCPYSHPNNPLHNAVRWGIQKSPVIANIALKGDDLLYGKNPKPRPIPQWMQSN